MIPSTTDVQREKRLIFFLSHPASGTMQQQLLVLDNFYFQNRQRVMCWFSFIFLFFSIASSHTLEILLSFISLPHVLSRDACKRSLTCFQVIHNFFIQPPIDKRLGSTDS